MPYSKQHDVNNWKRSDMENPHLADQFFLVATAELARKDLSLKQEQAKTRRLMMKVGSLIDVIEQLKSKNVKSENFRNPNDCEMSQ